MEHEVENKEGNYSIMRVLPYKTESRQIRGVVITFTDITEIKQKNNKLKKISEELRASEQHLKSLLDNTPDLIARFDQNLKYIFVNKALLEAGKQQATFTGSQPEDSLKLDDSEEMYQLVQEALRTGKERDYYFTKLSSTGEKHYYTRLIPEFNEGKEEVQSILSISTDITALKQAERKIISNNEQLSEMFERMDNFVHAVAHDLRAPIVNMKMLSQLILKEEEQEQQKIFVAEIGNAVHKLDNTLNGLIQIIEMENEHEIKFSKVDFKEILREVKSELQHKIAAEQANIETDFAEVPSIFYVEAYLESILKNLISNAIKYRSPERNPLIQVKTEYQGEFIVLTVADNGRGIDMEEHGRNLFKPFKRFHRETEGMGVGLYVIKYMVTKNGGHIEVESNVGEGTTFRIFLKPYEIDD